MKLGDIKHGLNTAWDSVAENWSRLRDTTVGALTRFRPGEHSDLPATSNVDDQHYLSSSSWSLLTGNVFEDDRKVIVRLEIPGMDKDNFEIAVSEDTLLVSGEKHFEREQTEGRYRSFQCAYGSFQRSISLPAPVMADKAQASYRDGILRIELPKEKLEKPRAITVKVD